ncbi:nitric oxide-associated protein 1 isoform X1 [Polistes fuscatus]|uniref:nitric oxide-associated protein 1 isoform X1 n=2 Tax=Polistes fuscatus TaxID=30207 RepID=UPI001CA81064|nr:nitric oxide-associated protein 1 isoform X1 [Polistes fuscatus]XP_043490478.1 nitric oxide-associated protein 1 isoform X1 [Polistes fuscatus]
MSLIKLTVHVKLWTKCNNSNDIYYRLLRLCSTNYSFIQKLQYSTKTNNDENVIYKIDHKIKKLRHKILYSEYLSYEKRKLGYLNRIKIKKKLDEVKHQERILRQVSEPVFSVILNRIGNNNNNNNSADHNAANSRETLCDSDDIESHNVVHMPYASTDSFKVVDMPLDKIKNNSKEISDESSLNITYKNLYEKYLKTKNSILQVKEKQTFIEYEETYYDRKLKDLKNVAHDWMNDYEQYSDMNENPNDWLYGTPNQNSNISNVPCGGCGALLHCKDHALPGYLPSEIFMGISNEELKIIVCQRCHFLKHYNTALEVKVSSEEYPELLKVIKTKKCAVILMVDLTDFPCSIWPDIGTILHPNTPVFIVGNKIDLLPKDSPVFEDHIKECVSRAVEDAGILSKNIKHVSLISAKTGYGVEELINKLHTIWKYKGDVFLIGCTNVGKSSLFNSLLQSDYCKVKAANLVQRATISLWPGTTLNLLKFPILNPSGKKLYYRMLRLQTERADIHAKQFINNYQLLVSGDIKYATLEGYVGKTFSSRTFNNLQWDSFSSNSSKFNRAKFGLDETSSEYKDSRWCYDTPGTIQPDQIMDLLTIDEILKTMPNQIISPRTFVVQPRETIFIGGLGRLDYLEGNSFIRCTIFASHMLPITMCRLIDADDLYKELLHTDAFSVPINDLERLKVWPSLQSKQFRVTGIDTMESAADVVLSNAGWIAVTPKQNEMVKLQGWTPSGRGIYLRMPALLKKSVIYRGARVLGTPAYKSGRQVYAREKRIRSSD